MSLGPRLRGAVEEAERRVKDKSYRRSPLGQEVGRYLRALRWSDHAEATLNAYEETLARLAIEHDDFEGVGGFCTPVGTQYLRDFLERHWGDAASATKRRHTAAVRSFCTWALAEGLCAWNPAASIRAPRDRRGGEERVAYAIPVLLKLVRSQESLRDQCALQLLCRMALRKNELRLLTIADVDLVRNLLVVTGKGGKRTVLPLEFRSLRDDLYLHIQGEGRQPREYLLYPRSRKNEPMDPASVHRWFKRCLEVAGLPTSIKPHEMRHSAADHLWRGTGNIVMAQELLRHSSPETTRRYLHPTRNDLTVAMHRLEEDWG
jgi:integrase/recombinase XerC